MNGAPRPVPGGLRADAARNHRALVAAARAAFEESGPDVPLEEVARRAGVGPSTLYRRFGGREELVTAVFAAYVEETIEPVLARAAAASDPARGLADAVAGIADAILADHATAALAKDHDVVTSDLVARFVVPLDALLARARAAGVVRGDLDARDLPALAMMVVATAAPFGGAPDPDRRDRYLAFVLDALTPASQRGALPPLGPPLDPP